MKCRYCGGEVGLEEKTCPYCGRPNEQAVKHHQNMASFRRRYAETEAEVATKTRRYAQIVPRTVIILLLLIAAVVMWVIAESAYSFPENSRRRAAERHPETLTAQLEGDLENRDYLRFAPRMNYHDIRTYNSPFSDYSDLRWSAECYKDFVLAAERLFLHGNREEWLRYSASNDIMNFCHSLEYFLEQQERDMKYAETESHRAALEDMRKNVQEMTRVFLGIDGETFDHFIELSDNKKAAYIEEVLLGE